MSELTKMWEEYVKKTLHAEDDERTAFPASVSLTVGDIEEILSGSISKKLQKKLEAAHQQAKYQFSIRNVDFGDFKED
jgi:hypothetical protein